MRYSFALIISFFLAACNNRKVKGMLETAVQNEVTKICVTDLATTGKITKAIQIDSLEIDKISKKEYYDYELKLQDAQFKKFVKYLKQKNETYTFDDQANHDKVMAYLQSATKTASEKPEIYKVDYYVRAITQATKYNQRQTTFLDSSLKKISADYSFLK
jgi:hypothetical protein